MTESYLQYWGLKQHPFLMAPNSRMMYVVGQYYECIERLKYAIATGKGGALLVSEEAGLGKTTIIMKLIEEMKIEYGSAFRYALVDHPTLSDAQIVAHITNAITGLAPYDDKLKNLMVLKDALVQIQREGGKSVIVVDEGQMLCETKEILQELRALINLTHENEYLHTFILSGQRALWNTIKGMPEFFQRLPIKYYLMPLQMEETKGLVRFRLSCAGGDENRQVFTEDALEIIHRYTQGLPRAIIALADLSLLVGYTNRVERVSFQEVSKAMNAMSGRGDSLPYVTREERREVQRGRSEQPPPAEEPLRNGDVSQSQVVPPVTVDRETYRENGGEENILAVNSISHGDEPISCDVGSGARESDQVIMDPVSAIPQRTIESPLKETLKDSEKMVSIFQRGKRIFKNLSIFKMKFEEILLDEEGPFVRVLRKVSEVLKKIYRLKPAYAKYLVLAVLVAGTLIYTVGFSKIFSGNRGGPQKAVSADNRSHQAALTIPEKTVGPVSVAEKEGIPRKPLDSLPDQHGNQKSEEKIIFTPPTNKSLTGDQKRGEGLSREVFVSIDKANVRARPDVESHAVAIVSKGFKLTATEVRADADGVRWYKVLLREDKYGWISERVLLIPRSGEIIIKER